MSLDDDHGRQDDGGYGGSGHTRTRLPEGDGGVYGTPRRPGSRSPRSLVTVVAVVVLLIAAIAFANRGGGDGTSDSAADDVRPDAAPTAPSGRKPVSSGFGKDREGVQSAAANYAVALASADILKPTLRPGILKQVFVADKVPDLAAKFDKAYSKDFLAKVGLDEHGNAADGLTYVSRTAPIGTKAVKYAGDTATVEVWCTGVFGTAGPESKTPVANDWFTMTLSMRWTGDDWRVESFSQKPGPAPVNSDNRVSGADEIAKAVEEFGGFTYAR